MFSHGFCGGVSFESLCLGMLDAIAALARGALRTLLGVSTVYANARGMQRPATNEELLAKMGAS